MSNSVIKIGRVVN